MTCPQPNTQITKELISDQPLFRSWLLLFGLIPVEYDLLRIVDVEEGVSFSERSSMGLLREWNHDRILTDDNSSTEVIDKVSFTTRIPFTSWIIATIVRFLFHYRHYRLGRKFSKIGYTESIIFNN
jgi:ligand-binding SRPBCC domain-containing protein